MAELKVHERTALSTAQYERRARIRTLLGGTDALREARTTYLPQRAAESDEAYRTRLLTTWLFEGYKDSVEDLGSRPFKKPVTLEESLDKQLRLFETDADAEGTSLSDFAQQVFVSGIHWGLEHVLVNFPKNPGGTLADDRERGLRPYFERICDDDILGFYSMHVGGKREIVHLRVQERTIEPKGTYDIVEMTRVRVYDLMVDPQGARVVRWQLFEPPQKGSRFRNWVKVDEGNFGPLNHIPLHTFYTNRVAFLIGEPSMSRLADKNIELWQSESMQVNSLDYARSIVYFGAGFPEMIPDPTQPGGSNRKMKIGGDQAVFSASADAKFTVVEHQGKAIEAGRQRGLDLKEEMVILGLRPMVEQGQATATGRIMDDERASTVAEQWVRNLEQTINAAFKDAGTMINVEVPDDVFAVSEDFGISNQSAEKLVQLIKARELGDIPRETFLEELKRYGVLRPSLDVKELSAKAQAEGDAKAKAAADAMKSRLSDFPVATE